MSDNMYLVCSSDIRIAESGEHGGAVTSVLKFVLDTERVDGVVAVKAMNGDRYSGVPVLITESAELSNTSGSLHCSTPNIARFINTYLDECSVRNLAVVGKPCDIRAIIELQKRNQIELDELYLVGLNCTGSLSPTVAKEMLRKEFEVRPSEVVMEDIDDETLTITLEDGTKISRPLSELESKGYGRRENCRRCEFNIPTMADLACGKWGTENVGGDWTFVEACSEKGKTLIHEAVEGGFIQIESPDRESIELREKKNQTEIQNSQQWIEHDLKPLEELSQQERFNYWMEEFGKCVKCFGCRDACPICYCDNCILEANRDVLKKGVIPPNALFPLTRLSHVADSCVNCGQCQDACPMELPLTKLFTIVHKRLSSIFEYTPGIDEEEPPPLLAITDEESNIDDVFLDISSIDFRKG
ncbi:MAG: formate dehydrogenase [Candidatus Lokiarchaeota archaeon]|nr:formate dehydrogenase [Candidatus Lokiarchaeota archaeon]